MPEFYGEPIFGIRPKANGPNDTITEVHLTYDEYINLLNENSNLKKRIMEIKHNYTECDRAYQLALNCIAEARGNAKELQQRNENLIRIIRERANADRDLRPKRKHDGYVVLRDSECDYFDNRQRIRAWRAVIETPYPRSIDSDDIRNLILMDLDQRGAGERLCVGRYYDSPLNVPQNQAGWYKLSLDTNAKSNYWNIILFHSKALKF